MATYGRRGTRTYSFPTARQLTESHPGHTTYRLIENTQSRRRAAEYLVVEHYWPSGEDDEISGRQGEEFVLRWPSSLDAETVLESLSKAFVRHDVGVATMTVGTDRGVERFEADIPIALNELVEVLAANEMLTEQSESLTPTLLRWIRVGADPFDLYADMAPTDLACEAVIGVFVDDLNLSHLEDLYMRTSARYLLTAWLRPALEAIRDTAAQTAKSSKS